MIYAHYDKNSETYESLDQHLQNVVDEMRKGLETVSFSSAILSGEILDLTGGCHDMGKITNWFQDYLLTGQVHGIKKNHSLLSAAILYQYCKDAGKEIPLVALLAIVNHHGDMVAEERERQTMETLDELMSCAINRRELCEFGKNYIKEGDFSWKKFNTVWRRSLKQIAKEKNPEYFFALQLAFSQLISADKRASAGIAGLNYTSEPIEVEAYIRQKSQGQIAGLNDNRNRIRNSVLERIRSLSNEQVKKQRIFTLTAPTGTGKTLTSLAAALELKRKVEEIEGIELHLILAVPFLNILEQTIQDYEAIFGPVLVNTSTISTAEDYYETDSTAMSLQRKMLLANAWESPVVLTTFVQFFESILTGKHKRLLKVNRLANAIVILDEVQALEAEYYPLYAVVMDMLAMHYGTRFILMTATQPKMFDCAEVYQYQVQPIMELLPDYKNYFNQLRRTRLISKGDDLHELQDICDFIEKENLADKNILIVVNTIADSIKLHQLLKEYGHDVMYLSTNLTGYDRKRVIREAKSRLHDSEGEPFIMVATQTIEAGVDLDFDLAFRDMAPMPSIIQIAGRVNRSGNKEEFCPIYLFDSGSARKVYSYMAVSVTKEVLGNRDITEDRYQELVEEYYDRLIHGQVVSFNHTIYEEGILKLNYEEINKFQMIEDSDRYPVIFLQNEDAEELVQKLCQELICRDNDYDSKIRIQRLISQLSQYTVEVYTAKLKKNLPISFRAYSEELVGHPIDLKYLVVAPDDMGRYYNETGYVAEQEDMYLF